MALLKALPNPRAGGPDIAYWIITRATYDKDGDRTVLELGGWVDAATRAWKFPEADARLVVIAAGILNGAAAAYAEVKADARFAGATDA